MRKISFVGVEVLRVVTLKNITFRDVTMCTPVDVHRRFGRTYCLHLRIEKQAKEHPITFRDVTLCRPVDVHRRFGRSYCLHLRIEKQAKQHPEAKTKTSACYFIIFVACLVYSSILKTETVRSSETPGTSVGWVGGGGSLDFGGEKSKLKERRKYTIH
jgi:hypothetical protein